MDDSIKLNQPTNYIQYPESSVRKYRAPYAGSRTSQQFNLIQQEILSDINFIYDKLETSEQNKSSVYSLIDILILEDI